MADYVPSTFPYTDTIEDEIREKFYYLFKKSKFAVSRVQDPKLDPEIWPKNDGKTTWAKI